MSFFTLFLVKDDGEDYEKCHFFVVRLTAPIVFLNSTRDMPWQSFPRLHETNQYENIEIKNLFSHENKEFLSIVIHHHWLFFITNL